MFYFISYLKCESKFVSTRTSLLKSESNNLLIFLYSSADGANARNIHDRAEIQQKKDSKRMKKKNIITMCVLCSEDDGVKARF